MDRPEIIKTQHDTVTFCFWLQDHPEITKLQGWAIDRLESGVPYKFGDNYADAEWMWKERKVLNDWIRSY